jgi:hypothetical protein
MYWKFEDGPLRPKLVANSGITVQYYTVVLDAVHILFYINVKRWLNYASRHINTVWCEAAGIDEEVYRDGVSAVLGGRGLTKAAVILAG